MLNWAHRNTFNIVYTTPVPCERPRGALVLMTRAELLAHKSGKLARMAHLQTLGSRPAGNSMSSDSLETATCGLDVECDKNGGMTKPTRVVSYDTGVTVPAKAESKRDIKDT